jgi:hypothetical protein
MLRLSLILCLLLSPVILFSQEEKQSGIITSIAEELAAEENNQQSEENFADMLRNLVEDPVALNSADEKEISRLFFLTTFQVKILCDYVKRNGRIYSIYEIVNIPGFDEESARMLQLFITLSGGIHNYHDSAVVHHTLLTNMGIKPSASEPAGIGSPLKVLTRYRISAGNFSGGITIEKDQGEKLISGKPPLPDFLSANMSYRGDGFVKRVILGDYSARSGQGIALNSGAVCGYSLSAPVNLSGRDEIRPYTSADENNFFRGIAMTAGTKNTDISIFLSVNTIDATIKDTTDEGIRISSLYRTGLHNSSLMISKKDVLKESAFGLNISHSFKNLYTGIVVTGSRFSLPFSPDSIAPAGLYAFTGRSNLLYSGYYSLLIRKFILSGEFTFGGLKRYGFVQNFAFRPADRLTINMILRSYSPGFITFHGRIPVSGSSSGNEMGITGSFAFEAARFLFINAGTDLRIYPWMRYRCSAPSSASRYELRLRYLPTEKLNFEILYSYRLSVTDKGRDTGIALPSETAAQSVRFQTKYRASENLSLITRVDYRSLSAGDGKGLSLLQDIAFNINKVPVSLWIRYGIFSTSSYETGIYTWENDLLYSYSVPVLYGIGRRLCFLVKWVTGRKAEFRFKYGITSSRISGMELKYSDEFKFQFLLRL